MWTLDASLAVTLESTVNRYYSSMYHVTWLKTYQNMETHDVGARSKSNSWRLVVKLETMRDNLVLEGQLLLVTTFVMYNEVSSSILYKPMRWTIDLASHRYCCTQPIEWQELRRAVCDFCVHVPNTLRTNKMRIEPVFCLQRCFGSILALGLDLKMDS